MARQSKYPAQIPNAKGTPTHRKCIDEEAERRGVAAGQIVREALDGHFQLADGEWPDDAAAEAFREHGRQVPSPV